MNIDIRISVESESNRIKANTRVRYSLGTEIKGSYRKKDYSVRISDCNCNRAVLEGLYDALLRIKGSGHAINLSCPSWFIVNSIRTGLILRWAHNGHRNFRGKDVAHTDLWIKITPLILDKCGRQIRASYSRNTPL
ncbi:MAG: hypothetical protein K5894_16360 [Lachnospiraceae bacterium]|nr:hypothetical protein [Lachnospiraceae bacterium]